MRSESISDQDHDAPTGMPAIYGMGAIALAVVLALAGAVSYWLERPYWAALALTLMYVAVMYIFIAKSLGTSHSDTNSRH